MFFLNIYIYLHYLNPNETNLNNQPSLNHGKLPSLSNLVGDLMPSHPRKSWYHPRGAKNRPDLLQIRCFVWEEILVPELVRNRRF
jgi:hypothetical protein